MSNPFNELNKVDYSSYKSAYELARNTQNPMQMLNTLAKSNPNVQSILRMLNGGANPQQLFYSLCQQRGINPTEFLKNVVGR